jgi:hypothetical protein
MSLDFVWSADKPFSRSSTEVFSVGNEKTSVEDKVFSLPTEKTLVEKR